MLEGVTPVKLFPSHKNAPNPFRDLLCNRVWVAEEM